MTTFTWLLWLEGDHDQLNSDINVEGIVDEITEENIYDMVKGADVVIDAMDNFNYM